MINSLSGWNNRTRIGKQFNDFLADNRGIDTVALKMVFYLAITGTILLLISVSWGNVSPFFEKVQTDEQIKDAAVELLSIQNGYARNLRDGTAVQGSTCTIKLSLPENIRYLAMGVDPDTDCDGNLSNSDWILENGILLIQYDSGEKNRFLVSDDNIRFRRGIIDQDEKWSMDHYDNTSISGIVIEKPVSGDFIFELVYNSNGKYTLSHF